MLERQAQLLQRWVVDVVKVHDCGAFLQVEMRPPLFQREMLRPIAFDSGMATSYLAPETYFAT